MPPRRGKQAPSPAVGVCMGRSMQLALLAGGCLAVPAAAYVCISDMQVRALIATSALLACVGFFATKWLIPQVWVVECRYRCGAHQHLLDGGFVYAHCVCVQLRLHVCRRAHCVACRLRAQPSPYTGRMHARSDDLPCPALPCIAGRREDEGARDLREGFKQSRHAHGGPASARERWIGCWVHLPPLRHMF